MSPKINKLSSLNPIIPPSKQENYLVSYNQDDSFIENFFGVIKRRWLFISGFTCMIVATIFWWAFQQSPIYQGKFLLLLEKQTSEQNKKQPNNNNLNNDAINPSIDYSTEIKVLGSAKVLAPILQEIAVEYPDIYQDINLTDLKNLKINQVDQSKIIEVVFADENREKVEFVLEKISNQYSDEKFNPLQNNLGDGLKFIEAQTTQLQSQVELLENQLQKFREKHNLIDPQITAKELTEQLVITQQQYGQTKVQLEQARNQYNNLQQQLNLTPKQAIALVSLSESKNYKDLQKQLAEIDLELAKQSAIFTEKSPNIITLKEKRENLAKLLNAEIGKFTPQSPVKNTNEFSNVILNSNSQIKTVLTDNLLKKEQEVQQLEIQQKKLEAMLTDLQKKTTQMPAIIRQYNELTRLLNNSAESLNRWLKTKEDLEIKQAQNVVKWTVLSPLQLDKISLLPFSQLHWIIIVVSSLTCATVVAFIIDLWDDSIYNLTQLKKITLQPVLSVISKQKKYNFLSLNQEDNYPSFEKISNYPLGSECFRNLYINLRLLQDDNNVNSIVISSFNSHVENVNISINLAKTAATLGRKVLLIDANLTNPQIHQLLKLENQHGLTDILAEKIELFSAIQKVPQEDNLSVITVGKLTNNLSYLFFYPTLKKTIDDLINSQLFDLIIYDTSCILDFADAKMIASYTDGIVLALKMGKTKAREVQKAIDELDIAQISLLGLVQA